MVLVKKWPFFQLFCLANIGQENVFYDILELKNWLCRLKKQQIQTVEKLRFFIFRQYSPEKCAWRYSRTKKRLSRLKKQHVQKVEQLKYFQRSWPMVLVQKWPFFQLFLFKQYRPGKCVLRYSRTKKRFSTP